MKRSITNLLLPIIFFCYTSCLAQDNKIACIQYEQRLNTIKDYLDGKTSDSTLRRAEAIVFLEKITGIFSNADIIDGSQLEPSFIEYGNWENWYQENKSKLYLDKRKRQVRIKK